MSVEKSFIVAKGFRDLEVLAKSMDVPPTQVHTGYASPGSRYCDNGSCATCIKQASRDKNARQTHSHVTKGYLVSVNYIEKADDKKRSNVVGSLAEATASGVGAHIAARGYKQHKSNHIPPWFDEAARNSGRSKEAKGVAEHAKIMRTQGKLKMAAGGTLVAGSFAHNIRRAKKNKQNIEKGLPSALKSKTYKELGTKSFDMTERAYAASRAGSRSAEPHKVSNGVAAIAGKHQYGLLARESKRAGDERQAQIWINAGKDHKRSSPANFNGWMKPGRIESSDAGKRMAAIREKRLARQRSLEFAKPTLSQQSKPSW